MTKTITTRVAVALALCALSSGCVSTGGGKFSCPAPDGVTCMSTTEIYEATNNRSSLEGASGKPAVAGVVTEGGSLSLAPSTNGGVVAEDGALSLASDNGSRATELPLRAEARVMRIWIAPWTDEAGDLVMPGHIFTEIEGRRWTLGGPPPSTDSTLFDPNRISGEGSASFNPDA